MDEVGWRAAHCGDAQVLYEHAELFGVAAALGDDGCPDALHALVGAHAACEEAVAIADDGNVVGGDAAHQEDAGGGFGPDLQVLPGVGDYDGLAGGAA